MTIGIFYKRRKTADFAGLLRTYTSEVLNIYDVIKLVFDAQSIIDFLLNEIKKRASTFYYRSHLVLSQT